MTEMQVGDQTIRYDRDATAEIYGKMEGGFAEECGCIFCKNFAAQRKLIYPASFRALLELLGVDLSKEGEAFECGPDDGRRSSLWGMVLFCWGNGNVGRAKQLRS